MIILIAYLLLALGVSFLCSILEASLLSMPPSFVRRQGQTGRRAGQILERLKANIDRPLSAILTLNTIAHTVGAAGVGSQAVKVFGQTYFGLASAILTLLILVFSEIIPKTLGAQYWRSLSGFTAYACRGIVLGTLPLVWLSERITRVLQPRRGADRMVSRDELVALAQLGRSEGVLAEKETRVIRNLIRLRSVKVENIMTPRTVMGRLPDHMLCRDAMDQPQTKRFSRVLLYSEKRDNIVGYVLKSEIYRHVATQQGDARLSSLRRSIRMVSEFDSLSKLFDELLTHNEQIALVVDEYGAITGVVTMEDLIETLLGSEIVDESDRHVDLRALAREQWTKRARRMGLLEEEENEKKA